MFNPDSSKGEKAEELGLAKVYVWKYRLVGNSGTLDMPLRETGSQKERELEEPSEWKWSITGPGYRIVATTPPSPYQYAKLNRWILDHPGMVGVDSIPDKQTRKECLIDVIGGSAEIISNTDASGVLPLFLAFVLFEWLLSWRGGWYALLAVLLTGALWFVCFFLAETTRPYRNRNETLARRWIFMVQRQEREN